MFLICCFSFFFFNDTATTEIYTLSLHDALPISVYAELPVSMTFSPARALAAEKDFPVFAEVKISEHSHNVAIPDPFN